MISNVLTPSHPQEHFRLTSLLSAQALLKVKPQVPGVPMCPRAASSPSSCHAQLSRFTSILISIFDQTQKRKPANLLEFYFLSPHTNAYLLGPCLRYSKLLLCIFDVKKIFPCTKSRTSMVEPRGNINTQRCYDDNEIPESCNFKPILHIIEVKLPLCNCFPDSHVVINQEIILKPVKQL